MKALIGKKIGMTQVYDANNVQVPVTVIEIGPCVVVQQKNEEQDAYNAVQLGFEDQKPQRLTKAVAGHFAKANVTAKRHLREVRLEKGESYPVGQEFDVSVFEGVAHVDVTATTKGRGFQGVVKRYRMAGGPAAHGSGFHRRPGSIGMREKPGRVFKGKRMPGHMGNVTVTTQNLKVVAVRIAENVLLVRGAVPGPNGGIVYVSKALKKG